jgi:hypothetical protein
VPAGPQIWAAFSPLRDNGRWLPGAAGGGWLPLRTLGVPEGALGETLGPWLGYEAGVHHSQAGSYTIVSLLGGLGVTIKTNARVAPFAQFVAGLERCCGENAFAIQPGGGVDYWFKPTLAFRGQIDFRIARYSGETFNETRVTLGVVLPITRK